MNITLVSQRRIRIDHTPRVFRLASKLQAAATGRYPTERPLRLFLTQAEAIEANAELGHSVAASLCEVLA